MYLCSKGTWTLSMWLILLIRMYTIWNHITDLVLLFLAYWNYIVQAYTNQHGSRNGSLDKSVFTCNVHNHAVKRFKEETAKSRHGLQNIITQRVWQYWLGQNKLQDQSETISKSCYGIGIHIWVQLGNDCIYNRQNCMSEGQVQFWTIVHKNVCDY